MMIRVVQAHLLYIYTSLRKLFMRILLTMLTKKKKRILLTMHVDDLGRQEENPSFMAFSTGRNKLESRNN